MPSPIAAGFSRPLSTWPSMVSPLQQLTVDLPALGHPEQSAGRSALLTGVEHPPAPLYQPSTIPGQPVYPAANPLSVRHQLPTQSALAGLPVCGPDHHGIAPPPASPSGSTRAGHWADPDGRQRRSTLAAGADPYFSNVDPQAAQRLLPEPRRPAVHHIACNRRPDLGRQSCRLRS